MLLWWVLTCEGFAFGLEWVVVFFVIGWVGVYVVGFVLLFWGLLVCSLWVLCCLFAGCWALVAFVFWVCSY